MARPKKVKEDEVVTIVDDKNTEALLPQEVEPTGVEVIEEEKPVTYDPNEGDEVSEVEEKEVEKVNAKQPVQASYLYASCGFFSISRHGSATPGE